MDYFWQLCVSARPTCPAGGLVIHMQLWSCRGEYYESLIGRCKWGSKSFYRFSHTRALLHWDFEWTLSNWALRPLAIDRISWYMSSIHPYIENSANSLHSYSAMHASVLRIFLASLSRLLQFTTTFQQSSTVIFHLSIKSETRSNNPTTSASLRHR